MARSGARRHFGRVDPFVLFMVLPLLLIAGVMVWGGLAWVGVLVIVFAVVLVLADSWSNRPLPFDVPGDEDYDYDPPGRRTRERSRAERRVSSEISLGANTRSGGPQKPAPRLV